jgi:hypothetical protein
MAGGTAGSVVSSKTLPSGAIARWRTMRWRPKRAGRAGAVRDVFDDQPVVKRVDRSRRHRDRIDLVDERLVRPDAEQPLAT